MLGDSDFERLRPIFVRESANIHLLPTHDDITLETDDRVQLIFTPTNALIIGGLESAGEYVRVSAIVNIIDTNCKNFISFIFLPNYLTCPCSSFHII